MLAAVKAPIHNSGCLRQRQALQTAARQFGPDRWVIKTNRRRRTRKKTPIASRWVNQGGSQVIHTCTQSVWQAPRQGVLPKAAPAGCLPWPDLGMGGGLWARGQPGWGIVHHGLLGSRAGLVGGGGCPLHEKVWTFCIVSHLRVCKLADREPEEG